MDIAPADLALRQVEDYYKITPGTYFAEHHPSLSLDEAYLVQNHVAQLRTERGGKVAGYKIGCLGPMIQRQFGIEGPIRGFLYQSELRRSRDVVVASAFANLAVEGEMAITLGKDGTVVKAFPVIELHNYVIRGKVPTLQELIANNGLNAGVILPEPNCKSISLESEGMLELFVNGKLIEAGALWHRACIPREMLDWLRAHLDFHDLAIEPGHIVLTGTMLGLYQVNPGDHIRVVADGSVAVEAVIAA